MIGSRKSFLAKTIRMKKQSFIFQCVFVKRLLFFTAKKCIILSCSVEIFTKVFFRAK